MAAAVSATSEGLRLRPAQRIWLEVEGTRVFGPGMFELLTRADATHSLRQAAAGMGLAYSKAWQILTRAETHLGYPLLDRRAGGREGGGSSLTAAGRDLLQAYGALVDEAEPVLDALFAKHFDGTAEQ